MKIYTLLPLAVVLVATSPVAATVRYNVSCFSDSSYTANSTYEANLRRLAAILPAAAAASAATRGRYVKRAVGYWPDRLQGASSWWSRDADWGACVADAFKVVQRKCPYRREVFFISPNCTLHLAEFHVSESRGLDFGRDILKQVVSSALIFQAIGLAFLFYIFVQRW